MSGAEAARLVVLVLFLVLAVGAYGSVDSFWLGRAAFLVVGAVGGMVSEATFRRLATSEQLHADSQAASNPTIEDRAQRSGFSPDRTVTASLAIRTASSPLASVRACLARSSSAAIADGLI